MDEYRRRRQSALDDLQKALKLVPKQPQAYLMIARLNMLPGGEGAKAARDALDKALALKIENPTDRAEALVRRSELQTDPDKKLADLDEAVRIVPGNADVVRARALALADMNKLEPALADLDKAISLDPKDERNYEAKALVLAQLKKYDESLAVLKSRLDLHVDDAAVLMLRSTIYEDMGKTKEALADVDKVLELKPGLIVAIRRRALLLTAEERYGEAALELEKLRENDPHDLLTLMQLGLLYSAQKKSEKSIAAYSAVLAIQPDVWQALRGRGDAYLNLGKQAEALADYEKALKLAPKDHGILNNLAWVLATSPDAKLRDGKRAVQLAAEACQATDYKLAYILSTLAAAYAETGDFDSAVKWAAKAVELADKDQKDQSAELKKELESYRAKKPWRERLAEENDKKAEKK